MSGSSGTTLSNWSIIAPWNRSACLARMRWLLALYPHLGHIAALDLSIYTLGIFTLFQHTRPAEKFSTKTEFPNQAHNNNDHVTQAIYSRSQQCCHYVLYLKRDKLIYWHTISHFRGGLDLSSLSEIFNSQT